MEILLRKILEISSWNIYWKCKKLSYVTRNFENFWTLTNSAFESKYHMKLTKNDKKFKL